MLNKLLLLLLLPLSLMLTSCQDAPLDDELDPSEVGFTDVVTDFITDGFTTVSDDPTTTTSSSDIIFDATGLYNIIVSEDIRFTSEYSSQSPIARSEGSMDISTYLLTMGADPEDNRPSLWSVEYNSETEEIRLFVLDFETGEKMPEDEGTVLVVDQNGVAIEPMREVFPLSDGCSIDSTFALEFYFSASGRIEDVYGIIDEKLITTNTASDQTCDQILAEIKEEILDGNIRFQNLGNTFRQGLLAGALSLPNLQYLERLYQEVDYQVEYIGNKSFMSKNFVQKVPVVLPGSLLRKLMVR